MLCYCACLSFSLASASAVLLLLPWMLLLSLTSEPSFFSLITWTERLAALQESSSTRLEKAFIFMDGDSQPLDKLTSIVLLLSPYLYRQSNEFLLVVCIYSLCFAPPENPDNTLSQKHMILSFTMWILFEGLVCVWRSSGMHLWCFLTADWVCLCIGNRVLQCSHGWPRTPDVHQAGHKLTKNCLPLLPKCWA